MTELQQNRYDQLIRRVGNIVSPGSMVNDALNELFPMIDVENLNAELSLLTGWRLAYGTVETVGVALNQNLIQLFNPADSGHLVVIERIDIRVPAAENVRYALSSTPLTNFTANQERRDSREGVANSPIAQLRDVNQLGGIPNFGVVFVQTNVNFTMQDKRGLFVLAPNTGLTVANTIVNNNLQVSMQWRERIAEPAELNFPRG